MTETFVRACIKHKLPLDGISGLECPRGHTSSRRHLGASGDDLSGEPSLSSPDRVLAWLVVHVASGRVAATVIGAHCQWEPWIEETWEERDGAVLAGRSSSGFTAGADGRREQARRAISHRGEGRGWRRGHAA